MPKNIELLQAINTKIFHDLSGSIGTINNCLSLIDNSNKDIRKKAKKLAFEESSALVNKIKLFKNIYGMSEGESEVSVVSIKKILKDFFNTNDIKLDLQIQEGMISVEEFIATATICLALMVSETIYLESLEVKILINGHDKVIKVIAHGKNIKIKESFLEIFSSNNLPLINVYNCREHYVYTIINNNNYYMKINKLPDSVEYSILKNA